MEIVEKLKSSEKGFITQTASMTIHPTRSKTYSTGVYQDEDMAKRKVNNRVHFKIMI